MKQHPTVESNVAVVLCAVAMSLSATLSPHVGDAAAHVVEGSCMWMAATSVFLVAVHLCCGKARYGWIKKLQLAVCCMAGIHGATTTYLSAKEILKAYPVSMDMENTTQQEKVVFLSTGYFLFDLLQLLLTQPHEVLFILHHFIVTSYMMSSYVLGRGMISSLVMMCIGEVTSPLLNTWLVAKDLKKDYEAPRKFFDWLSPFFTIIYVFFRTILGPPVTYWVVDGVLKSHKLGPLVRYSWSIMVTLGTLGSQAWSLKLVKGMMKRRKSQKKIA